MSNASINAHIAMGEPCGEGADLATIADWAGELVLKDTCEITQLKARVAVLESLCKTSLELLLDAKQFMAPTTDNSDADYHIAKLKRIGVGRG